MAVSKTFGIISYFPDEDSDYHIEMRRERSRRFRELLFKLDELWPDVDIMVIAQNWQDFELPQIKNKITVYHYGKLGILGARRELRKRFLASDYDYLIMLDDDFIVSSTDPQAFLDEIDKHPDGFGAIRRAPSPLPFFSISKYIYSLVDMPNIDPEKGEGFEDDVFSATCFARFPDRGFMFPEGLANDASFHYKGPGECPSTWSREHKYDWNYMRSHTKSEIHYIEQLKPDEQESEEAMEPTEKSIDLLITYVNSSDTAWVRDYIRTTHTHVPTSVRFRPWGTLKYLFRGIEKYMPFIRNVVLVVARQSQTPVWINRDNVRVVYHDEFIPKEFLPTFNSCTIESFFWNIKGLSDRVIYFNDDMFPTSLMHEEDFFTGDKPHLKFTELGDYSKNSIYHCQCRSGLDLITKAMSLPTLPSGKMFRPYHISNAITRAGFDAIRNMCADAIRASVSAVRQPKNVNQYIYAYYQYYTNNYINEVVDYKYFEISDANMKSILEEILRGNYKLLCLNDSDKLKDYNKTRRQLSECFEKKFPKKCKYEV